MCSYKVFLCIGFVGVPPGVAGPPSGGAPRRPSDAMVWKAPTVGRMLPTGELSTKSTEGESFLCIWRELNTKYGIIGALPGLAGPPPGGAPRRPSDAMVWKAPTEAKAKVACSPPGSCRRSRLRGKVFFVFGESRIQRKTAGVISTAAVH